jgi:uncharacterized protein
MAVDKMKELYDKLGKVWHKAFDSDIITTAWHITPEVIETLKYLKIGSMQITLDGRKETHNKIKFTDDCDDVFSKTIRNIDLLMEQAPDIRIDIRVNLTKENRDEYVSLYQFFTNRYAGKKLNVNPAPVCNRGAEEDRNSPFYFDNKEWTAYLLNLFYQEGICSPLIRYPARFFEECATRTHTSVVFDPEGYVYKCIEIVGNKKYAVGKLNDDGVITEINNTLLNRYLFGADTFDHPTCSQCSYLPVCNGGCPHQRIENEFEGGKNDVCTHYKGCLPELMKAYIRMKDSV